MVLLGAALGVACGSSTAPLTTGLRGVVTVGPVAPLCMPEPPCYVPVTGSFSVVSSEGTVATFDSDVAGRYEVRLPPGQYRIVPGPETPIPYPETQELDATVAIGDSLSSLDLQFSSYIR